MKLDFAQHAKRTMLAGLLFSGIRLVFPFLNRTLFLWLLGPEFLGLNGLFTSILGVLSLAELGFGRAVICSMYKPVADGDRALLRAYLRFYRTLYRTVGLAVFGVGLCLAPFLRQLIHGDIPAGLNLYILYFAHLFNTAASYFFFAYRGSVLAAHARRDVISNISSFVEVGRCVGVFLVLFLTRNYYGYVAVTVAFTLVYNLLLLRESRRLFPDLFPEGKLDAERRRSVLSDAKSIFLHKIGSAVTGSTDNLVISSMLGLVGTVSMSMLGGFGNKIYTESRETNFRLFLKANRLVMLVTLWCAAVMSGIYQPFIEAWTRGDPTLVRHFVTPVLMVLYFFVNQSRQTLLTFKAAASLWKEDRWKPIVASVANLGISVGLVLWLPEGWKLDGVIFGTIVSMLFIQVPWETHVLFTKYFTKSQKHRYWMEQVNFAVLTVWACFGSNLASSSVVESGVPGFLYKAVAAAGAVSAALMLLFRKDCLELLDLVRKK